MTRPDHIELVSPIPAAQRPLTDAASAALAVLEGIADDPGLLAGLRVGLVDNSKTNALELLSDLQSLLGERSGTVAGPVEPKEVSGPLSESAVDRLRAAADLVLVASAD
jgi:hypothetical protein